MKRLVILLLFLVFGCTNNFESEKKDILPENMIKEPSKNVKSLYGIKGPFMLQYGKTGLYSVKFEWFYYTKIPIGAQARVRWEVWKYTHPGSGYRNYKIYKKPSEKVAVRAIAGEFISLQATLGYWDPSHKWRSVTNSKKYGGSVLGN